MSGPGAWPCRYCPLVFGGPRSRQEHEIAHQRLKRARGNQPLVDDDTSTAVGVTLPTRQFDAYARRALREDVSVPEIIRRELRSRAEKKSTK